MDTVHLAKGMFSKLSKYSEEDVLTSIIQTCTGKAPVFCISLTHDLVFKVNAAVPYLLSSLNVLLA